MLRGNPLQVSRTGVTHIDKKDSFPARRQAGASLANASGLAKGLARE
jgi:hypothetical protein